MQLKSLLLLSLSLLTSSVLADSPVISALSSISSGLSTFGQEFRVWNGDIVAGADVFLKAQDLLDVIANTTATLQGSGTAPISFNEAIPMLRPVNQMVKETEDLIDGMVAKKAQLDKAQLASVARDTLVNFRTGTAAFVAAMQAKLPANTQAFADSIGAQIMEAMDRGIAAYSEKR